MSESNTPPTPNGTPPAEAPPVRPDLFAAKGDDGKRAKPRPVESVRILSSVKPAHGTSPVRSARLTWLSASLAIGVVAMAGWYVSRSSSTPAAPSIELAAAPAPGPAHAALASDVGGSASMAASGESTATGAGATSHTAVAQAMTETAAEPGRSVAPGDGSVGAAIAGGVAGAGAGAVMATTSARESVTASETASTKMSTTASATTPAAKRLIKAGSPSASRAADSATRPSKTAKAKAKAKAAKLARADKAAKAQREAEARQARTQRREGTRLAAALTGTDSAPRSAEVDVDVIEALLPYVRRRGTASHGNAAPSAAPVGASPQSTTTPHPTAPRVSTAGNPARECAGLAGAAAVSCRAHLCAGRTGLDPACPALPLPAR